jgi:hypothetical protein
LGAVGRQRQQADVVGDLQASAALMPSGSVQDDDGVGAWGDPSADLGQMQGHGFGVDIGQHQAGADASGGADGAEQIGPAIAAVAGRGWTAAALGPDAAQRALLADPGLVLPPELDRLASGGMGDRIGDQSGEVFLCAAWAAASWAG